MTYLEKLKEYVKQCQEFEHFALIDIDLFNLYLDEAVKELKFDGNFNTSGLDSLFEVK